MITQVDGNKSHTHTFHGDTTYTSNILNKDNHTGFTNTGGMSAHTTGWFTENTYENGFALDGSTFVDYGVLDYNGAPALVSGGAYRQKVGMQIEHSHNMEHVHSLTPNGHNDITGDTETKPINYTIKIWKRIT